MAELFQNSIDYARRLDAEDPLRDFRDRFLLPTQDSREQIYFLGNSLGLQPKTAIEEIGRILQQWADYGVEGFFSGTKPWMDYHDQLTKLLSTLTGARPQEITVMNQLTVNLHLMMVSFYRPAGKRNKILCEAKAFPSDQYMLETHLRSLGFNPDEIVIEVPPRAGEFLIRTEDIFDMIERNKNELALVLFSGVNYYTGQVFDIKAITQAAHSVGIPAGFDLAHAVGNVFLDLHEWNVDFACWCSYKYLNSGPGAVGGVYIHERYHRDGDIHRLGGWWGHDKATRFKMEKGFRPIQTAEGWQLSTPALLLYAVHKAALDIFEEAGWRNLLMKQKLVNNFLWFVLDQISHSSSPRSSRSRIEFITSRREQERGCQVSMLVQERGSEIFSELTRSGVMADWREPNVIRIAPVPLYNTFEEVWKFGNILQGILD